MSEAKHTPGPWKSTDHGDRRHRQFAIMAEGGKIGSVFAGFGAHFDLETSEANARLIAAAPDLLAVCVELSTATGDEINDSASEVWARVAAAIAKATGARDDR